MADRGCLMNSMRYNPSQALRLLLDPLISAVFRQVETDFRGFLHSEPDETRTPYPGRFCGYVPSGLFLPAPRMSGHRFSKFLSITTTVSG